MLAVTHQAGVARDVPNVASPDAPSFRLCRCDAGAMAVDACGSSTHPKSRMLHRAVRSTVTCVSAVENLVVLHEVLIEWS